MKEGEIWKIVEHPGYFGKNRDLTVEILNNKYGLGQWKLAWVLRDGSVFCFDQVFWQIYVPGYAHYFAHHRNEANWITAHFAYGFDKDPITKEEAFDPHALYEKPGQVNQFHHVAFNIALQYYIGHSFRGRNPLQVREGKPGTPSYTWSKGWQWSPGRIPTTRPDLIPLLDMEGWWRKKSIEDLYQLAKVVRVRQE